MADEAMVEALAQASGAVPAWEELLPALQRLDARLEAAVSRAESVFAPGVAGEQFRGLFTSEAEALSLLDRAPGEPLFFSPFGESEGDVPRLERLRYAFGLSSFEVDVVVLALAPELDRRYERLYAYLQDNVNLRRPSVDLALQLLCESAVERIQGRDRFRADRPLIDNGIVHLAMEPGVPLLAASLKLNDQVVSFLLQDDRLDPRLAPYCRLESGGPALDDLPLQSNVCDALRRLVGRTDAESDAVRLRLIGPEGGLRHEVAASLAAHIDRSLLDIDVSLAVRSDEPLDVLRLFRQATLLYDALPSVSNVDTALGDPALVAWLTRALDEWHGPLILSASTQTGPLGTRCVDVILGPLAYEERRRAWQRGLDRQRIALPDDELDEIADRLRLGTGQIEDAIGAATGRARIRGEDEVSLADLYDAACDASTAEIGALARRARPTRRWQDIVLPPDTLAQLHELCARVRGRRRVLDEWGFGEKLSLGRGTVALFTGPAGAGKTMAAEVIAGELRLDLCKIDLSRIVSKYIGETERNLRTIFDAAERANAILFFDEADALFGKRSEVRDSHDRYANMETSFLLQQMEEYDGVAILATNLRQNLDEAFIRRFAFSVAFPFPDEAARRDIWRVVWPSQIPLAAELDLDRMAEYRLAGGNIKNIALAAAFLAAEHGRPVTNADLQQAARREFQKLGKVLTEAEFARPLAVANGSATR